jgi:mRNA interferase RelE/StbE
MSLGSEPRPPGCVKVRSEEGVWRIRVSDWRVGYLIDDVGQVVTIIRVGHRSEFYD